MKIVLASGSPRRLELLRMIGLSDFEVIPDMTEEVLCEGIKPEQTVCKTALAKAKNVSRACDSGCLIIAADTEVYLDGEPFGKPKDAGGASVMLRRLSGKRHTVYTGIAIIYGDDIITASEATEVYFREISESEIKAYVETGEPMDKAGAYGAQGRGAVFIERLEGDFFNVMGLPVCRVSIMLRNLGVDI
ncbi:MAG: Maf family protein [Oscillospiraceae bacterium]|nr:Maf family protein [Oscillospiraceae bacterium]